jgi:hypothetical protein
LGSLAVLVGLAGTASASSLPTSSPIAGATPRPAAHACADADGDGLLTVTDGVVTLRAAAGLPSPCDLFRCDLDGSGEVTVTDGVGMLGRVAGLHIGFGDFYRCPVPTALHDASDFSRFRFSRQPAFGFCAPLDSVLGVEIERQPDGTFLLHATMAAERPLGDPDCIDPIFFGGGEGTCIAPVAVPDRPLTADELARLRAVFAAIETYEAPLPICEVVAIDPCVINQLDWDDFGATDFECHGRWVGSVAPVTDVLDALVASP